MTRPFYSEGGLNAETYDVRTLGFPGEIDFYVSCARASGGPVLEVACGTGRVSWPVARAGVDVVGLDLTPAMLEQAERKRHRERPEVSARARFVLGDMTDFALDERFALAIIPFRAFQVLLGVDQQRRSLGCLRRHLRAGGRLIIDVFDPRLDLLVNERSTAVRDINPITHPVTGRPVMIDVLERLNDHVEQRLVERWRFREIGADGKALRDEEERLEMRWIYRFEMQHLLELSGFAIEEELSDFRGAPRAYGQEQIWVARREDT